MMTDTIPAPEMLRQMIHCNCFEECNTQKCTCRKNGLECTSASGHCHDGQCDNMTNQPLTEKYYDENYLGNEHSEL